MFTPCALLLLTVSVPTPLRTTADVDDAYALRVNPGGLGLARSSELRLLLAHDLLRTNTGLGAFGAYRLGDAVTIAGAAEWDALSGPVQTLDYSLGMGVDLRHGGLGFAWSEGATGWSAGMTIRPTRWFSFALAGLDLAEDNGSRLYDLGLALRPFGERVTLGGRWRIREQGPLAFDAGPNRGPNRLAIEARLEVEPLDGVRIAASTDLHNRVGLQATLAFEQLLVGGFSRATGDGSEFDHLVAEVGLQSRVTPTLVNRHRVAVLELSGDLVPDPSFNLFGRGFTMPAYGAAPLLLETLADSERVEGVFLKIGPLAIGWGRAEELRNAIVGLRKTGRRVDCYLTGNNDLAYFVASACQTIAMPPSISLAVDGIAINATYLGDGLERIGIRVETERVGKWKTGPERFTRNSMSLAERESIDGLLDQIWGTLVGGIAEGRALKKQQVELLIDRGTLTATEAQANKLVDAVLYPDELDEWVTQSYGGTVNFVGAGSIERVRRERWGAAPRIAIIPVDAAIAGGLSRNLPFGLGRSVGGRSLAGAIEQARTDKSIVGVVLRVDSPGGDAVASDLIARAVTRLAREKPVIASFGDIAASGGYYVAAGAHTVFAQPTTITGSIGVYSLGFSVERLMGRLGLAADAVIRGRGANRSNAMADSTPAHRAIVKEEIEHAYRRFVDTVAEGREMKNSQVQEVAQGRVWTGEAARRLGLVDRIGGLGDAIRQARVDAGLAVDTPAEVVILPRGRPGWSKAVRRVLASEPSASGLAALLPAAVRRALAQILPSVQAGAGQPLALLPYAVEID